MYRHTYYLPGNSRARPQHGWRYQRKEVNYYKCSLIFSFYIFFNPVWVTETEISYQITYHSCKTWLKEIQTRTERRWVMRYNFFSRVNTCYISGRYKYWQSKKNQNGWPKTQIDISWHYSIIANRLVKMIDKMSIGSDYRFQIFLLIDTIYRHISLSHTITKIHYLK